MYAHPCEWVPTRADRERMVRKDVTEAGSTSVQWVLIVEVEITLNQGVLRFDHVILKDVLEFTQKDLFLFDGGGR